ncbi:four helix bundle protein [Patescibacteria group bacterium]|nr:four helix bundle protein [Patescibacteria group bacterium]
MNQITNYKQYDLEDRSLAFAKQVRDFVKCVPKSVSNFEYCKQLIRSSGSVGANYIEANESLGKKDFLMRIRISKKESKESRYWLRLIDIDDQDLNNKRKDLINETNEFTKIFGSILEKSK